LESGAMSGAMFETYVVTGLLKSWWHQLAEVNLYYFRDKDGREIDLLISRDGQLYPLEIKKTANPNRMRSRCSCVAAIQRTDRTWWAALLVSDAVAARRQQYSYPRWTSVAPCRKIAWVLLLPRFWVPRHEINAGGKLLPSVPSLPECCNTPVVFNLAIGKAVRTDGDRNTAFSWVGKS